MGSNEAADQQPTAGGRAGAGDPWDDVAAHFAGLGNRIRDRFAQASDTPRESAQPAGSEGDAVRRAIDALDDAFTSMGEVVRDPAFRREAETSFASLGQAVGASLQQLGEQMQRRFAAERAASSPPPASGADDEPTGGAPGPSPRRPSPDPVRWRSTADDTTPPA
jgi:hypothetical protein